MYINKGKMFYQSVVVSVLFCCTRKRDNQWLGKIIRQAGSVVGRQLDSVGTVTDRTQSRLQRGGGGKGRKEKDDGVAMVGVRGC